jgi:hypothetical protein
LFSFTEYYHYRISFPLALILTMHVVIPIAAFAATAAATGFTIPGDQPEGVYIVSYDNQDEPIHEFISSLGVEGGSSIAPDNSTEIDVILKEEKEGLAAKRSLYHRLHRRESDDRNCGGNDLDHNTDMVVEALKRQCDPAGAIGGAKDFYSIIGSTVAYVCNFKTHKPVACWRDLLTASFTAITETCGAYRSGWRIMKAKDYHFSIGYEPADKKFCGRGPYN